MSGWVVRWANQVDPGYPAGGITVRVDLIHDRSRPPSRQGRLGGVVGGRIWPVPAAGAGPQRAHGARLLCRPAGAAHLLARQLSRGCRAVGPRRPAQLVGPPSATGRCRSTLARRASSVRAFTAWAHDRGWLSGADPGVRLASPKAHRTLPGVPRGDAVAHLLNGVAATADDPGGPARLGDARSTLRRRPAGVRAVRTEYVRNRRRRPSAGDR